MSSTIAVIDFETTGIGPGGVARATEVAIVLMQAGRVVDRFQSLMNAGLQVPYFITQLTGITNAMVASAPPVAQVMAQASGFVGDAPMGAHNASFDRKVWLDELGRLGLPASQPFACTVLLSRRLYPQAPNHKLGTLVDYHHLPRAGVAHRALADAEMAAALLVQIQGDLRRRYGVSQVDHALLVALQRCPKSGVAALMARQIRGPAASATQCALV